MTLYDRTLMTKNSKQLLSDDDVLHIQFTSIGASELAFVLFKRSDNQITLDGLFRILSDPQTLTELLAKTAQKTTIIARHARPIIPLVITFDSISALRAMTSDSKCKHVLSKFEDECEQHTVQLQHTRYVTINYNMAKIQQGLRQVCQAQTSKELAQCFKTYQDVAEVPKDKQLVTFSGICLMNKDLYYQVTDLMQVIVNSIDLRWSYLPINEMLMLQERKQIPDYQMFEEIDS